MPESARDRVTDLLSAAPAEAASRELSPHLAAELLPLVYDELRRLAGSYLRAERGAVSLDATGLVHEAYLRLVHQDRVSWQGRSHFFAIGAQMMRRLLVDRARRRDSAKRGGDWRRVTLHAVGDGLLGRELEREELLALDRAVDRLAMLDSRQGQVVVLRYFGGLEMAEIAELLGVSKRTVEGDWTHARAWLRRELASGSAGGEA